LVAAAPSARADTIFSGAGFQEGQLVTNWTLSSPNVSGIAANPSVVITTQGFPFPCWTNACAGSQWIAPTANQGAPNLGNPAGTYVYSTTFNLPVTFNPQTQSVTLQGMWAADDSVALQVNGQATGVNLNAVAFDALHNLTFTGTNIFQPGVNTLSFVVTNDVNASPNTPTGLDLCVTTTINTIPVPEPTSLTLAGLGIGGLAFAGWKRRRATPA